MHETQIAGDVQKSRNFCEQCYQATKPAESSGLGAALGGGCRYCGGEPYVGSLFPMAGGSGAQEVRWMCRWCEDEFYRLLDEKIPGFVECARTASVTDEFIARWRACDMASVLREVEAHMRTWAAGRGAGNQ